MSTLLVHCICDVIIKLHHLASLDLQLLCTSSTKTHPDPTSIIQIRSTNIPSSLFSPRTGPLYLPRASLPPTSPYGNSFDFNYADLDKEDNRVDTDQILSVSRNLAGNSLLRRVSILTCDDTDLYAHLPNETNNDPNRLSVQIETEAEPCSPSRLSIQTFGSSVLTYGSRVASLYLAEGSNDFIPQFRHRDSAAIASNIDSEAPYGVPRPHRPLPWDPRPSSIARISRIAHRPLPPIPASSLSVSVTNDSNAGVDSDSNTLQASTLRAPRPLPQPPIAYSTATTRLIASTRLEDIAEAGSNVDPAQIERNIVSEANDSIACDTRIVTGAANSGSSPMHRDGQLSGVSRAAATHHGERNDHSSVHNGAVRTVSQLTVPDVDELVRILELADTEEHVSRDMVTPVSLSLTGLNTDELDMGQALERSRGIVAVAGGGVAPPLTSNMAGPSVLGLSLPTPAPTPKPRSDSLPSPPLPPVPPPVPPKEHQPVITPPEPALHSVPKMDKNKNMLSVLPPAPDPSLLLDTSLDTAQELMILAPQALEAGEVPIPSPAVPSPSMGLSFAERAYLPGMLRSISPWAGSSDEGMRLTELGQSSIPRVALKGVRISHGKYTSTQQAIADLKSRVPSLDMIVPKVHTQRRRAFSSASERFTLRADTSRDDASVFAGARQHPYSALRSSIMDKQAGDKPDAVLQLGTTNGKSNADMDMQPLPAPYTPPPVEPLRLRSNSITSRTGHTRSEIMTNSVQPTQWPSDAATCPSGLSHTSKHLKQQRCVSMSVATSYAAPQIEPLRFRSSRSKFDDIRQASRLRSSSVSDATTLDTSTVVKEMKMATFQSEPGTRMTLTGLQTCIPEVAEEPEESHEEELLNGSTETLRVEKSNDKDNRASELSIDPAFADILKRIANANPDELEGSFLTIASSINTEQHSHNFSVFNGDRSNIDKENVPTVGLQEQDRADEKQSPRRERLSSSFSVSGEKRRSRPRPSRPRSSAPYSIRSARDTPRSRTQSLLSVSIDSEFKNLSPLDPEERKALPDPSTFPTPIPTPAVAESNYSDADPSDPFSYIRPSPLPKLKLVTKFKGNTILLPASQAPLSAVSTKSTASCMSTMSTFSGRWTQTSTAPRKLNRTLPIDPRSPMIDAAIAASALVTRIRQRRLALLHDGPEGGVGRRTGIGNTFSSISHRRAGSRDGTLKARLPLTGSGFFGYAIVTFLSNKLPLILCALSLMTCVVQVFGHSQILSIAVDRKRNSGRLDGTRQREIVLLVSKNKSPLTSIHREFLVLFSSDVYTTLTKFGLLLLTFAMPSVYSIYS